MGSVSRIEVVQSPGDLRSFRIGRGEPINLDAAGNVVVPAYLTLLAKGFTVNCERYSDGSERWTAQGTLGQFGADDPITLLGVICVAETRGAHWQADDAEIDHFLKKFYDPNIG